MKPKVAIQGVKGAFHEEAAIKLFGNDIEIEPCLTFKILAEKVADGSVDAALMAIENTISGTILSNFELIRCYHLDITAETYLRIRQNLAVLKGTTIEMLKEVHSHYMALNQCRDFFAKYPNIKLVESADTALSIREVAEIGDPTRGAIGSALAIEQYGLEALATSIETDKFNYTRFVVLNKNATSDTKFNKVSATIVLPHVAGSLSKVLSLFFLLGINLTKIESMPILGKPWQYRFFIDFILSESVSYEATIEALTPLTEELSILGRYQSSQNDINS